jgi:Tfp pilus assembly protein PilN
MIRINLNRTRVAGSDEASSIGIGPAVNASGRDALVKLLVVILGTAALMLYEKQNLDQLNLDLAQIQAQDQQIKTQVQAKMADLAKLKDIEPQAQGLNEKLNLLREYSKQRITELQSMDYVQSIIPERVWLRGVHFDNHRFQFLGNAVETVDLTEFVSKLENSAYFKDVIVVQDREKKVQSGNIRDFEFTAREEVKN